MIRTRTVTLHGSMVGDLWDPAFENVTTPWQAFDLVSEAGRLINSSIPGRTRPGLVDVVDHILTEQGGDFRNAPRFTGGSCIRIVHRTTNPVNGATISRERTVELADLPSIADYVSTDVFGPDDEE